jgi:hypothetical protein
MSSGISRDDWMRAMESIGVQSLEDDQSAITIIEFAAMIGAKRDVAKRRLEALVAAGAAVATYKFAPRTDGKRFQMRAFRLVDKAKRKKP